MGLRVIVNTEKLAGVLSQVDAVDSVIGDLASEAIVDAASERAPVRTGFMKSTIGRIVEGGRWTVFVLAHYSGYVEFGTRKMRAQPFLRPALKAVDWIAIIRTAAGRIGL